MLFEEKHMGHPISKELSAKIRKHTTIDDRFLVNRETGLSESMIRQVVFGQASLTEKNSIAVIAMLKRALENSLKQVVEGKESAEFFEEKLDLAS